MGSRLVVDMSGHQYSLDGKRVPSVTTIIGKATSNRGLINWAAKSAAEWAGAHVSEFDQLGESEWVAQAAGEHNRQSRLGMDNGRAVHLLAEKAIYGHPVPLVDEKSGEPFNDDVVAMGEQVARFFDKWDVEPVLVEAPVFHETERWAGRPDLVCDMAGERWLIDYKTGKSGIWPDTAIQCNAYASATHCQLGDNDLLMARVDRLAALWIRPGGWQLHPLRFDDEVLRAFRAMQAVSVWAGWRKDDSVGAPLPVPAAS